jgi:hypothetical protein
VRATRRRHAQASELEAASLTDGLSPRRGVAMQPRAEPGGLTGGSACRERGPAKGAISSSSDFFWFELCSFLQLGRLVGRARSRAAAARPPRTRRDFRCVDTAASVAEMPLTVQSIRRVLKAVRCFFLSLVLAAFAYFVYTMLALGGGGTLDVLGEVPVFLSER